MLFRSLQDSAINCAPGTSVEEILQNIRTIISTPKFSVPLDRDFGVDASFVDAPTLAAQAMITSEIFTAIKKYEPRVTVTNIDWEADIDGVLKPKVQVIINAT